jgi:hypothetical protein
VRTATGVWGIKFLEPRFRWRHGLPQSMRRKIAVRIISNLFIRWPCSTLLDSGDVVYLVDQPLEPGCCFGSEYNPRASAREKLMV